MTIDKETYTNITPDGEEICEVPLLTAEEKSRAVEDYCISIESDCNKCPISKYTKNFNENCYSLYSEKFPCNIDRNYEIIFGKPEINFVKVERNDEVERKTILETAKRYVCNDRNNQYGAPEDSFKAIADLWAGYLGTEISAKDVAAMMVLFKMARVRTGAGKADNWIDAAGYCACGGEIEHKEAEKNG